jgi:ribosome-associated protein
MEEFTINTEYIELCSLLKLAGPMMSGGQAKIVISEGMVKVNGTTETRKKNKVKPGSIVEFDSFKIKVI